MNEEQQKLNGKIKVAIMKARAFHAYKKARFLDREPHGPNATIWAENLSKELRGLYSTKDLLKGAERLFQGEMRKSKNVRRRLGGYIIQNGCWFITLTFNDDCLKSTSAQTRRRYVQRWCNENSDQYLANIDFGDPIKNPESLEREHYHAIIYRPDGTPPDVKSWEKLCGFVKLGGKTDNHDHPRQIKAGADDVKRVAKYTAKLSAHALKDSTYSDGKTPRMIYSRKKPQYLLDLLTGELKQRKP